MARIRRALPPGWRAESEYRAHWQAHKGEHPRRELLRQPKTPPRELIESLEILASREPQRPDLIKAVRIVAFYVTEHADGGKWLPGYYNPLLEKQAWQLLGQLARDYWVQFRTEGISLHHAAARVAAETASHIRACSTVEPCGTSGVTSSPMAGPWYREARGRRSSHASSALPKRYQRNNIRRGRCFDTAPVKCAH